MTRHIAKWNGPLLPPSLYQLLPASNTVIFCGFVVTNSAEPTDQLKINLAKTHYFHQVSSHIHPPCAAAHAQGHRAWRQGHWRASIPLFEHISLCWLWKCSLWSIAKPERFGWLNWWDLHFQISWAHFKLLGLGKSSKCLWKHVEAPAISFPRSLTLLPSISSKVAAGAGWSPKPSRPGYCCCCFPIPLPVVITPCPCLWQCLDPAA